MPSHHYSGSSYIKIEADDLPEALLEWIVANRPGIDPADICVGIEFDYSGYSYDPSGSWPIQQFGEAEDCDSDEERTITSVELDGEELPVDQQELYQEFFQEKVEETKLPP